MGYLNRTVRECKTGDLVARFHFRSFRLIDNQPVRCSRKQAFFVVHQHEIAG
jgi:hypothetical protein